MKEINSIYNYIELQLDEANNKLDIEWEEGKAQEINFDLIIKCNFPVSLRNRVISGVFELVLRHTEKLCIASYYIKFSTNLKMYIRKIKTSF